MFWSITSDRSLTWPIQETVHAIAEFSQSILHAFRTYSWSIASRGSDPYHPVYSTDISSRDIRQKEEIWHPRVPIATSCSQRVYFWGGQSDRRRACLCESLEGPRSLEQSPHQCEQGRVDKVVVVIKYKEQIALERFIFSVETMIEVDAFNKDTR